MRKLISTGSACVPPVVQNRNVLGNADDHGDTGFGSFQNGICSEGWWHKNHGRIGICGCHRFCNGVEDRQTVCVLLTTLARSDTANHLAAIFQTTGCVELTCTTSDALSDNFCIFVDEDAHIRVPVEKR